MNTEGERRKGSVECVREEKKHGNTYGRNVWNGDKKEDGKKW